MKIVEIFAQKNYDKFSTLLKQIIFDLSPKTILLEKIFHLCKKKFIKK